MDIRGSTGFARGVGSRVLMLLDGHPALSADGGEVIWESLPLLDLDQVEVVKGAYSALYGSNALGGVVNLVTKPVDDRPRTAVRVHAGVWTPQSEYQFTDHTLTQQGISLQHGRRIGSTGVRLALQREGSDGFTENGRSGFWAARLKLGSTARGQPSLGRVRGLVATRRGRVLHLERLRRRPTRSLPPSWAIVRSTPRC